MPENGLAARLTLSVISFAMHVLMTQILIAVIRVTASYRAIELGASAAWVGIIGASYAVLQLALATRSGRAIDRHGSKPPFILGGVVLLAGMGVFVVLGQTVWALILGSMMVGFAHLLCQLAHQSRIAALAEGGDLDRPFARYMMLVSVGQMVGPGAIVVFGGAQNIPDTASLFALCAILAAACLAVAFLIDCPPPNPAGSSEVRTPAGDIFRMPGALPAIATCTAVVCAIDLLILYLPVIGASLGVPAALVALMLTMRAVAALVIRAFMGPLLDLFGRTWLITGSVALSGIGLAALGVSADYPVPAMATATILVGFGAGLALPLTLSWLSNSVPGHVRGLAFSLRLSGNRLAQMVVPAAFGVLLGAITLSTAMVGVGALIVGTAALGHRALVRR